MCRLLNVTEQGYYSFLRNDSVNEEDLQLLEDILECINEDPENAFYGYRRVFYWLVQNKDYDRTPYRVRKIMQENGLLIKTNKKNSRSRAGIDRDSGITDKIQRDFYTNRPNEVYLIDITEGHCKDSRYYLCSVIDCFDGSVRGYSIDDNMEASLCCNALESALKRENCTGVIIHSDHGRQFTSKAFKEIIDKYDCVQSMGHTYCCYDNARMESFNATIKKELLNVIDTSKLSLAQIRRKIFDYVTYYNHRRITLFNLGLPPLVCRDNYFKFLSIGVF